MEIQNYTIRQLMSDLGFYSVLQMQSFAKQADTHYGRVSILKDNQNPAKGKRIINPPDKELKNVQRLLLDKVLYSIETPSIMGGGKGTSTVQIMKFHMKKEILLCFDISNFFPSITKKMVKNALRDRGFSWDVCDVIANLTTLKNCLPQGSPCSTQLGKIVISAPAKHLKKLLKNYGNAVGLSFWVDDIIISGPRSLRNLNISGKIYDIFLRYGFKLKTEKTRCLPKYSEQNALGLRVDKGIVEPDSEFFLSYQTEVSLHGYSSQRANGMRNYMKSVFNKMKKFTSF